MGETTGIAWTDHTFNPWWGCTKVSPGCANCYADTFARRTGHDIWGPGKPRRTFGAKHWAEPLKWNADAVKAGKRAKVFCASMADVFDAEAPAGELNRLWALIRATPWLDWQLLTKRPERIAAITARLRETNVDRSGIDHDFRDEQEETAARASAARRFLNAARQGLGADRVVEKVANQAEGES